MFENSIVDHLFVFSEILSFVEEYQIGNDHLRLVEFRSVFFIDNTSFETSFYVNEFSFQEKLFRSFSKWSPGNTVCVFCLTLVNSGGITVATIGRNREQCDFLISDGGFNIRVLRNISDEDDLVNSSHDMPNK